MKFAAIGRTAMLYNAIIAAMEAGHEPVIIVTCRAAPEYSIKEADFLDLGKRLNCPVHVTQTISDVLPELRASGAEVAMSVNWASIIQDPVLNLLPHGIINAHGGDLPRYRGNACQAWAIINGEKEIVLTLHRMTDGLDAGPIHAQRSIDLGDDTYIGEIVDAMETRFPEMFVRCFDALEQGTAVPVPQRTDVTPLRCYPRMPSDGLIDWSRSAEELARLVRASAEPYAGAFTFLNGARLAVWRARRKPSPHPSSGIPGQVIELSADGSVAVLCGRDILILDQVQIEGGERTARGTMIRSTRTRLGQTIHEEIQYLRSRLSDLEKRVRFNDRR